MVGKQPTRKNSRACYSSFSLA